jgi:hypothetical protein
MKRILLNLLFLLALHTVYAQTSAIRFSVRVDPQSAWFNSDENEVDPNGSIIHMNAGLNMDYYFAENYAFALGFGINNIGGKLLYADSTIFLSKGDTLLLEPGQSTKLNLQYIEIPIGLKLKTEELGYATYFLQLGFNPMFRLNAKATSDEASFDKEDVSESIILFNLGYHVGIGVEYKLGGSTALIGGLRWTGGLTNVTDNDRANVKTNVLSLHLGVLF